MVELLEAIIVQARIDGDLGWLTEHFGEGANLPPPPWVRKQRTRMAFDDCTEATKRNRRDAMAGVGQAWQ